MVIERGHVCLAEVIGATHRRPVLVVQSDAFNRSLIPTVVVVPLSDNLRFAEAPGNVLVPHQSSGLPRDTVAEVALVRALERRQIGEPRSLIDATLMSAVDHGLRLVFGLGPSAYLSA